MTAQICPDCNGSGLVSSAPLPSRAPCQVCEGDGFIQIDESHKLTVTTQINLLARRAADLTTPAEIEAHGLVLARSNARPDTQELTVFNEHDSADYILALAKRIEAERKAAG